ncbi:SF3a splicing factor complex subunit [Puccinia graminis f. sp. tritici]|uniref:SF3a splicing factor complex subunit n=1 Tax=Puccinia graminis f. sp. tritici TaxID=56615 RepID=A0A5B0M3I2_PUCGR|nr:SF3a splicing factor complex subunit [Puccinia graminis f. sp. tritici]
MPRWWVVTVERANQLRHGDLDVCDPAVRRIYPHNCQACLVYYKPVLVGHEPTEHSKPTTKAKQSQPPTMTNNSSTPADPIEQKETTNEQPETKNNTNGETGPEPEPENDEQTNESNELIQSNKYLDGLIYPPPEIRSIVDKTAAFIAKNQNPKLFEDKIRQREKTDSRFSFLNPDDAYNPYYRHRIEIIKNGGDPTQPASSSKTNPTNSTTGPPKPEDADKPPEPTALQFLIEPSQMPKINAVDLEIIKLTALFTARLGRKFVTDLSQRESRNYQFDFLRPSHSLFAFFNRLVEQYTTILIPPPEMISRLEKFAGGPPIDRKRLDLETINQTQKKHTTIGRRAVMAEIESRINWEKYQGLQLQKRTSEEEKEKKEFNEIDWEDFIVVSTVEFTENDEVIDLPPPMSISEVENMTIAQKKMAAMVMEGKDVSSLTEEQLALEESANDLEANQLLEDAKRSAEEAKEQAAQQAKADGSKDGEDEENKVTESKQTAEIKKLNPTGMKIRKDYVPKGKQGSTQQNGAVGGKVITTLCQICGQQINVNEISEHVRIELLDPRWKEKKQKTELNRSSSNMLTLGSDVSSSLRDLAKSRLDIFEENVTEEEKQRREAEQKKLKQLAKEKYTWDGHLNTGERVTNIYQTGANLDEQIQALHRSKGLTGESIHSGPQIGPLAGAMPPQPPPAQPNPALLQQQRALQLQQQQIDLHILNITSGLTGSGAPIPPTSVHHQPSFAGGATLSAAPQPVSSRPSPLIDPGRAAMISGSMHAGATPPVSIPPNGLGPPSEATPPITVTPATGSVEDGGTPSMAGGPNGTPSFPVSAGLPGRPNVPDFGAGIPGPQQASPQPGSGMSPAALTPMAAQLAIDNITNQVSGGAGLARPAEDDGPEGQPGAKKIKLSPAPTDDPSLALPSAPINLPPQPAVPQLFTEEQWIEMHPEPISLLIKLPEYPDKPEWGCDGSEIVLEELPITLLVGVLRDKLSVEFFCFSS